MPKFSAVPLAAGPLEQRVSDSGATAMPTPIRLRCGQRLVRHYSGQMDAALNWLFAALGTRKSTRILSPGFSFDRS